MRVAGQDEEGGRVGGSGGRDDSLDEWQKASQEGGWLVVRSMQIAPSMVTFTQEASSRGSVHPSCGPLRNN